jgi:hypothetical protein
MTRISNTEGWTLNQGLAAQYAAQAGLDPDLAADAGEKVWDVLKSLRDAVGETDPQRQAKLVQRTQARLVKAGLSRHGELVQHIEARLLALQGRGGDTELAHLTPGEVVVPPQLQTPEVIQALQRAAQNAGVDLARYTAGSQASSVNPETGLDEYRYSTLRCTDLSPLGKCLGIEEIGVTDRNYFYPGFTDYDGFQDGDFGSGDGLGLGGGTIGEGQPYGPQPEDEDPIEEIVVTAPNPNKPRKPWYEFDPVQLAGNDPTSEALGYFMQLQCLDGDIEACLNRGPVTPINPSEEEIATLEPVELEYRIDAILGLLKGLELGQKISKALPPWLKWSLNLPASVLRNELDQYRNACVKLTGCNR